MICSICQSDICIPVTIKAFGCYNTNRFNCHSMTRFCFECTIKYLQLNRSVIDRDEEIKCLFCPEKCYPKELNFENSFMFDFLLHAQLFPKKTNCPFCFGSYDNIFKHLEDCESSYIQCSCGYVTLQQLYPFHILNCQEFEICLECDQPIHQNYYETHLYEEHGIEKCSQCGEFIKIINRAEHDMFSCRYRYINCCVCHNSICFNDLEEHYNEHKKNIKNIIIDMNNMIMKLSDDYRNILKDENFYFTKKYLTE